MKAKTPPTSPKYKVKELEKLYKKNSPHKIDQPDPQRRKEFFITIIISVILALLAGFLGSLLFKWLVYEYPEKFSIFENEKQTVVINKDSSLDPKIKYNQIYQTVSPSIVDIYLSKEKTEDSLEGLYSPPDRKGSGLIVSSDGYILTTNKVINDRESSYKVITKDDKIYSVSQILNDPVTNLVFIKIKAEGLSAAQTMARKNISLGENSFIFGYDNFSSSPIFLDSKIQQLYYENLEENDDLIKSSENLNSYLTIEHNLEPSWEGRPLVYNNGKVIGIYSYDQNNKNIIIPATYFNSVVDSLVKEGEILRNFLGLKYVDLSQALNISENLAQERNRGLLIWNGDQEAVIDSSPADKVGLSKKDIIIAIDKEEIKNGFNFAEKIQAYSVGEIVDLKILRKGTEKEIKVTLEKLSP
ncbi:MAG: S1C family serine protease [Patescibacteria group bacterium]|nr:S1C family serine protease [Patescibacteria group bacterium]